MTTPACTLCFATSVSPAPPHHHPPPPPPHPTAPQAADETPSLLQLGSSGPDGRFRSQEELLYYNGVLAACRAWLTL